ncbi:MAG: M10 family metallopeptidase C-terminal domain-containing protein [Cyanobium sp.]
MFTVPSAALQQLASGIALLSVTAAGTGMPEAQQAFTVLGDDSGGGNGSGNTMGLRLRGTPDRDELIGADLDDRIHAGGAADRIFGYAGDDRLHGSYGADLLRGGAGDDLLVGAHGADVLSGGTGSDVFRFESIADSPTARRNRSADRILDFFSNDVIDLARFDPALTYIAAAPFSGSAGQLRFQQGQLQADVDGDRQADFLVQIRGSLSADQLIL